MKNCYIIDFNSIGDEQRGYLVALEENNNIPFNIKRVYYTYGVPTDAQRGFHAHKETEQILICLSGSIKVKCFDGNKEEVYNLDNPSKGIYLGTMLWHEMFDYQDDTVIMVLASELYEESDYIRNYDDFLHICEERAIMLGSDYFVHDKAIADTKNIGEGTKIWGFSHVFPNCKIGKNCNICEHVLIENDVILGDNVTIKSGVYIWDGIRIEDNVFVGPSVTFINDRHPRSKQYPEEFSKTIIKEWASLGANCTIMCGVTIGQSATVGAGSVVLRDVNPYEIVVGNPARVIGHNCTCGKKLKFENDIALCNCENKYEIKGNIVYKV